ncbi:unnamed protein product [Nippostrongylus brasiliensis]|uniref:CYTH domain-containing protein n=1 Tax=Nippostrongylus brasiliensis TaxID=27835 RepID=A0A0N4YC60_NIPBR|nr:unnamed protein product [Nippostrongylus brasiliensis]
MTLLTVKMQTVRKEYWKEFEKPRKDNIRAVAIIKGLRPKRILTEFQIDEDHIEIAWLGEDEEYIVSIEGKKTKRKYRTKKYRYRFEHLIPDTEYEEREDTHQKGAIHQEQQSELRTSIAMMTADMQSHALRLKQIFNSPSFIRKHTIGLAAFVLVVLLATIIVENMTKAR